LAQAEEMAMVDLALHQAATLHNQRIKGMIKKS
jgi:hypothetical protein